MPWLITLWCINAVVGTVLSALLIAFRRRFSLSRWLRDSESGQASASPSVSVVIAARNEERAVERTLREFAGLPGVAEVILVDDGSEDNTLPIARAVAAKDTRVRVLEAPTLPSGWVGKSHAIHWASQQATSDFLLFTDADVRLAGLPLAAIVDRSNRDGLDHVGGTFRLDLSSPSEAIVGPVFAAVAFVALGLVAPRNGAGSGAFNLVRASAYRRLNGHSAIRDRIVDDLALAGQFRRQGSRSRFLDTSPAVSVRLFQGMGGLALSISRWSVLFSRGTALIAVLLSACAIVLSCSILLGPLALVVRHPVPLLGGNLGGMTAPILAVAVYLLSAAPFVLAGWLHSRSAFWGFLSPVGQVMMAGTVCAAAMRFVSGKRIQWRGRSYPRNVDARTMETPDGG